MDMDYCGPRGIPRGWYLGGPYVWTDECRQAAQWWLMHEKARCPNCGTRPDEWDPAKGGHDHAYVPKMHKCWGCASKNDAEKHIDESDRGTVWVALEQNPEAVR